jgi:hypothetical protein
MPALITSLRDAQGRPIVSLPIAVRQALMAADELLRLHGMQFEIVCETCSGRWPGDPNRWTVIAEHGDSDGSLNGLVCACTRRKFVALF